MGLVATLEVGPIHALCLCGVRGRQRPLGAFREAELVPLRPNTLEATLGTGSGQGQDWRRGAGLVEEGAHHHLLLTWYRGPQVWPLAQPAQPARTLNSQGGFSGFLMR